MLRCIGNVCLLDRIGGKVGLLYAINTFGAVLGVFVAGFIAIPGIGVQRTLWITAAVNGLLGLDSPCADKRRFHLVCRSC